MDSNRKTSIIVGVLFIIASVSTVLLISEGPHLDDSDYLIMLSGHENRVMIGVFLQVIIVATIVGIPVMMYPIFKRHNESLAIGYVGVKIIEAVILIVGTIILLVLLTLSQEFVKAGAPDALYFQTLGTLLLSAMDWTMLLGNDIAVGLGSLMFYYLLYKSRIIPRFVSVWGLIGGSLIIVAGVAGMLGIISTFSDTAIFLNFPIVVNEIFLAIWLIVKGFNLSAIGSESAKKDTIKA